MTVPVLVTVQPGDGPYCKNNFTYHFYLPQAIANDPPKPNSEDVFVTEIPEMTIAVASYGGWSNESKVVEHSSELFAALEVSLTRSLPLLLLLLLLLCVCSRTNMGKVGKDTDLCFCFCSVFVPASAWSLGEQPKGGHGFVLLHRGIRQPLPPHEQAQRGVGALAEVVSEQGEGGEEREGGRGWGLGRMHDARIRRKKSLLHDDLQRMYDGLVFLLLRDARMVVGGALPLFLRYCFSVFLGKSFVGRES